MQSQDEYNHIKQITEVDLSKVDELAEKKQALKLAPGSYQRALVNGYETLRMVLRNTRVCTMICPQCKRDIVMKINEFGDICFRQHKIASVTDLEKSESELRQDYRLGYDGWKYPLWQIDCPMSNQPVDSF